MEQIWMVIRENSIPDQPNVVVSVHKSEAGAIKASKEIDGCLVWHDGPFQVED